MLAVRVSTKAPSDKHTSGKRTSSKHTSGKHTSNKHKSSKHKSSKHKSAKHKSKKMVSNTDSSYLMYKLGTNKWQRKGEYAPGSGVLHRSHHQVFNSFDNNIYSSEKQMPHEDPQVQVFKLSHPIPICESASPVSSYRWHTMSDAEFQASCARLEEDVYNQMRDAKEREGTNFKIAIAHHCFLSPLVLHKNRTRAPSRTAPWWCSRMERR